ncbi:hypothetical protein BC829DRAFT_442924 [Chytridium lagenaria]|nr:hypothetical protein BC829DRAFT_442924 [Chytridium lagenaria]
MLAHLIVLYAAAAAKVRNLVAFGDSLTDNGRGNEITSAFGVPFPNSYFNNRLSNGPTYIEVIASKRNISLINEAISGATTSDAVIPGFLGDITIPGGFIPIPAKLLKNPSTLTTVWSGGNDAFNTANPFFNLTRTGDFFAKAQYDNWAALANAGSTKILTIQLARTTAFNIAFGNELFKQAAIEIYDMSEVVIPINENPAAFGFEKGPTDVCCVLCATGLPPAGRAVICENPDKWILYDDIHPTAEMHRRYAAGLDAFIAKKFGY